jgi:hypothetical protein
MSTNLQNPLVFPSISDVFSYYGGSASNSRDAHRQAHSQTRRVSARPESDRDRTPASAMGRSAKRDEAVAEASFARYMKPVRFGSPGSPPGAAGEDVFSNKSLFYKAADVTGPPPDARAGPFRNMLTPALRSYRAGPHLQFPEAPIQA